MRGSGASGGLFEHTQLRRSCVSRFLYFLRVDEEKGKKRFTLVGPLTLLYL